MILIKILLSLLLCSFSLFGALTFENNHKKEVELVQAFDINPQFLRDKNLQAIINYKRSDLQNKHFFKAMDDAYLFIPLVKSILSQSELPAEFLFLAMAESNFSTKAFSRKKASGLWQFMPRTGRRYGLKIDDYVDERRDLVKSTDAAIKYLTYLHKRFGKWYLAALAYNCGEGRLSKAIKKAKTTELSVLVDDKKRYLPRESRRYIRKIVALAIIGTDESFLIKSEYAYLLNRANAYSIATVKVAKGEKLSHIASSIKMPLKELKKLNRHLKHDFVPPYAKDYDVYIPYVKLSEFKQNYVPSKLDEVFHVHIVKNGESLSRIGKRYGVSYRLIKDFNNLKSDRLRLKQRLIIPVKKASSRKAKGNKYLVKKGDTLDSIAKSFKMSVSELKKRNNKRSSLIRIGEKLSIYD